MLWLIFSIFNLRQNHPALSILAFALGILYVLGMNQTNDNLAGIEVIEVKPPHGAVGEPTQIKITLENRSNEPRFLVSVQFTKTKKPNTAIIKSLPPGAKKSVELTLIGTTRGVHQLPRLRISTLFPLGLFFSWKYRQMNQNHWVYPRPEGKPLDLFDAMQGGDNLNVTPMRENEEFLGHRPFQLGDSPRRIDWKAHARGKPWLIKEFEANQKPSYLIQWKRLEPMGDEAKLSQIARWVIDCYEGSYAYSLILPSKTIPLGSGLNHLWACLRELAVFSGDNHETHS